MTKRWATACHEAGHLVAARELLGDDSARAYLLPGSGGGMMSDLMGASPTLFGMAVVASAGELAGRLAKKYKPPIQMVSKPPAPVVISRATGEPVPEVVLADSLWSATSDHRYVALWAISGPGERGGPLEWWLRYRRVRREAKRFIREHRQDILEAARKLHTVGQVTLEPTF